MADQAKNESLRQIARQYLRARGEPSLRDDDDILREAHLLITHGNKLTQQAEFLVEMAELFGTRLLDPSTLPDAWDNLVRDHSEEDMAMLHRLFPHHSWPLGVAYPNLVALVGHVDAGVVRNQLVAMMDVASLFMEKAIRVGTMAVMYTSAHRNPLSTSSQTWEEAVRDFEYEDFDVVREVFPRELWPHERHRVPYPNLVALVRWNNEQWVTQSLLVAVMSGTRTMDEWRRIWDWRGNV